jgi:hypothetical protein
VTSFRLTKALCLTGLLVVAFGFTSETRAQDEVSKQIWLDYNPRWLWPSGLELFGDIGVRTELNEGGWGRIVVRPGLRGSIGRGFQLAGGVGGFYTGNEGFADRFEIRPFQGLSVTWPDAALKIGWKGVREGAHWRLLAHFEGFLTLTGEAGQFDERVRLGLDIERAFASPWQVRGGVTWQQERAFSSATTDEVYIRVRFFHTLTPS